jgi:hypothetical protein
MGVSITLKVLESECQTLRTENITLKASLKAMSLDEISFRRNEEKVRAMTGICTYEKMMGLFVTIVPYLKSNSSLEPFKQFVLTLLRLRFNIPLVYLSYRFHISLSTTSRIFNHTIDIMNTYLYPSLVVWPDKEELRQTLPMSFHHSFRKCACIIDCFEIFIERPSDFHSRAQTYSSYKSHNTMKYLIGVTPQGTVSFISDGWGGRTSDKHITEVSGFLDKIEHGDLILADRGFDVHASIGLHHGELKIPAFTKGKQQLSSLEIESTRGLASVRIHVERVIGLVRQKYTMLQGTVPISLLDCDGDLMALDKIVRVACALTNVCGSVVPSC